MATHRNAHRPPTASLYLRISVERETSDSLLRQERALRALAAAEGLEVVGVHVDEGVSGSALKRPAYRAWLDDARTGKAGTLLAKHFDRISREGVVAVARLLDVLEESGARLRTADDHMDSDGAEFRIMAAVMSEVAYAERKRTSERVADRQASDRRNGRWTKTRPIGYQVVDARLVQDPTEAPIVRELVERTMAGQSLRASAAWLADEGVPTPRAIKGQKVRPGAKWGISSVRVVLSNPALMGRLAHRDGVARDDDGEAVIISDEPILTGAEFAALQQHLDSRSYMSPATGKRTPAVGRAPSHPLSGFLKCGKCGGPLVYDSRGTVFRCGRHTQNGAACPDGGVRVRAQVVRDAVVGGVLARVPALELGTPEFDAVAARWLGANRPEDSAERAAAAEALAEAEAATADLEAARYERGEFPGDAGHARWSRLYGRAMGRESAARDRLASFPEVVDVGGLLDAELLAESLADDAALRELVGVVMDHAVVSADGVEFVWAR